LQFRPFRRNRRGSGSIASSTSAAAEVWVLDPIKREQRALDAISRSAFASPFWRGYAMAERRLGSATRKRRTVTSTPGRQRTVMNLPKSAPRTPSLARTKMLKLLGPGLLFACTKDHRKPDGASVRVMKFAPASSGDRELTFAVRAGRLLQQIWVGGRGGAVVDQLFVDWRHSSMPDDVFFLIVMSRWAIARAFLAASATSAGEKLAAFLQAAAVKIYRSTLRYGPLDPDAEQGLIERLDASLGFPSADTVRLIESCRRFAADVATPQAVIAGCGNRVPSQGVLRDEGLARSLSRTAGAI
jgi:hypothetical protein